MVTHGFAFGSLNSRKKEPKFCKHGGLAPLKRDGEFVMLSTVQHKECRWPYNLIDGDLVMCGRPTERGPYCPEHHAIADGGKGKRL